MIKHNANKLAKQLLILICMLSGVSMATAQVTIGSNNVPISGALLDLKQYTPTSENVTATKGLMLPRLKLTDLGNLYPMFEDPGVPGTPIPEYQGALKTQEDLKHVGLLVYNLDECQGLGEGAYIWTGDKWISLFENIPLGSTSGVWVNGENDQTSNEQIIHIPSGVDLRPFASQQTLEIGWTPSFITYLDLSWRYNTIGGGLDFTSNPVSGWVRPGGVNPTTYIYEINDMTTLAGIKDSNPWQTRETAVKFEAYDPDECGVKINRLLFLNQTNYALKVHESYYDFNYIIRTPNGYDPIAFKTKSNAAWKATYTEINSGILSQLIYPTQGGKELPNGTAIENTIRPVRADNIENLKYKIAGKLYLEDSIPTPNHRFEPITLSIVKCQGQVDMSPVTTTAAPDETSANNWNNKVVRHQAKILSPGDTVYHEFYSADFGPAGRWMVTNLAALKYDTNQSPVAILPYDGTGSASSGNKVYAYPRRVKKSSDSWGDKPTENVVGTGSPWYWEQGLLYNWFTATNRAQAPDTDEGQIANATPGPDEVESKYESSLGAKDGVVQGICPNGWHIPSDREWNRLEKEVYNNPTKYSIYDATQVSKFDPLSWQEAYETSTGRRGSSTKGDAFGHAGVLHSLCPPDDIDLEWMRTHKGYSKPPYDGGFNIISIGYISTGDLPSYYGYSTMYWSSSRTDAWTAYTRQFDKAKANVSRMKDAYYRLLPVRCVKD